MFHIILACAFFCLPKAYADSIYNHPLQEVNQPEFKQIQMQLSEAAGISGQFKQIRQMRSLAKPLVSSGSFVLSKTEGLVWRQTKPFASTMTVTQTEIKQTMLDNPPTIITKNEQPIVFAFTNVFLSLFQGNAAQIEQYFNLYFSGNASQWEMALKPKGSPMNKAIVSIELQGGQYISSIAIQETQQNKMTIDFANIKEKE